MIEYRNIIYNGGGDYRLLNVVTPDEALEVIRAGFTRRSKPESVDIADAVDRVLAKDILSTEYIPGFDRSMVDGYAVRAGDTFGSSESLPALLALAGEVKMGEGAPMELRDGECAAVPTGGELPGGADAVVMIEYAEDYGDGTIGIIKPAAPGNDVIFRGDDARPGDVVLGAGAVLTPHDIGILADLGIASASVREKPIVGIISTGDELVGIGETPSAGRIRDVNSHLVAAQIGKAGGTPRIYGIVRDDIEELTDAVGRAVRECDAVLISGGSSVGQRDVTAKVIGAQGEILLHGIAMKPGKPTIVGKIGGKPVFGLPGNPVAAYFVTRLFVVPLLGILMGAGSRDFNVTAALDEAISSNHGRAEYMAVRLEKRGGVLVARPVRGKSGLIIGLAGTDGYIAVPRDCEGVAKGTSVEVTLW